MPLTKIKSLGITDGAVTIADLAATGTPSATTFLRGDNSWVAAGGANTPAFFVTNSSSQTGIDNTTVKVQFNSETFDTDNAFDPTTNYRFTVPSGKGGKYFISAAVRASDFSGNPNTLSRLQLFIKKNGTNIDPFIDYDLRYDTYIYGLSIHMNVILNLSATDYLEVFCFTDSTGNPGLVSGNCWFQGYRLVE